MNSILSIDKKPETIEFMKLLDEMHLNVDEQKVMLGVIQGVKLAKSMEQYKRSGKANSKLKEAEQLSIMEYSSAKII